MMVGPFRVFLLPLLAVLAACSESAGFRPVTPRILPNHVRLPGVATIRVGDRFTSRGFVRLRPMDPEFPPFLANNSVFRAPLNPGDSLEVTWVTMNRDRVRCVMMQRRQSYREAFDSLSALLEDARPVWTDSSSSAIQAVWEDGYVRWWVAGHWYPGVYPVVITVMAADPVGSRFDASAPDMC